MSRSVRRLVLGAAFGATAIAIVGCASTVPKHLRPLSYSTISALEQKGFSKEDPILLRIYKQDSELELWKRNAEDGKYRRFKTYDICKWAGVLGPKKQEGDRQAPEGFYSVAPAQMNPNSAYHLSFNIGFPNAYDRANDRTGTYLMVHGACSSAGCYSMQDDQIQEIYSLAREAFDAGQKAFQVQAFPFRMTPQNMALNSDNENIEFWRMLKEGSDHFEVTGREPAIGVCDRKYVFNAQTRQFDPVGPCPADLSVPAEIQLAVAEKQAGDRQQEQVILARLEKKRQRNSPADATAESMLASADGNVPATTAAMAPVAFVDEGGPSLTERVTGGLFGRFRKPASPVTLAPVDIAPVPAGDRAPLP